MIKKVDTDEIDRSDDFESTIIDNRDQRRLYKAFKYFTAGDIKSLKIASGYFYAGGFNVVKEHLRKVPKIRIIIGTETDQETESQITAGYKERIRENLLKDTLSMVDYKKGNLLNELHDFIATERVEIRVYTKSKFHAKAYIFEAPLLRNSVAIIGSSNFSERGLGAEESDSWNVELNSIHYDKHPVSVIDDWFEEMWKESSEYKSDLLEIIENLGPYIRHSTKDTCYVSPTELFQTMVYEYSKDEALQTDYTLAEFQKIGVYNATHKIEKYRGCIVADSVGLGKTLIGLTLIKKAISEGKNVLLIVPKHVESNWRMEINGKDDFRELNASINNESLKILTINKLSQINYFDTGGKKILDYIRSNYNYIVIDEAHRLRNNGSFGETKYIGNKNYANLKYLKTHETRYVLLTATPLNNSVEDLENLIDIFTDETTLKNNNTELDFSAFKEYRTRLKKIRDECTDTKTEKIVESIQEDLELKKHQKVIMKILEEVMILRTRTEVSKKYPNLEIGGKKLMTEPPKINPVRYKADEAHIAIYGSVSELINDLKMPHIITAVNEQAASNIMGLFKVFLYKRLESSIMSFTTSLENLEQKEHEFMNEIKINGLANLIKKYDTGALEMQVDQDYELTSYIESFDVNENKAKEITNMKEAEEQIINDIKHDLKLIRTFIDTHVNKIRTGKFKYNDAKINKLVDILKTKSDMKVLIFSQYIDTVEYIYENIKDKVPGRRIDCVVGADMAIGSASTTLEKINRFAPTANKKSYTDEIDILVSTDTLSEGVNLQDCSIIVNYDLPWNPMRITQRVGRIDRIGSISRTIVYNILPDENLDVFLKLLDLLSIKISNIANIIGKENHILSENERIDIKTIGEQIKKLHSAKSYDVYEGMNRNPLLGEFSFKNERGEIILELKRTLTKYGINKLEPRDHNVYSIIKYEDLQLVFVMFHIYDNKTNTKMKNSIVLKYASDDSYKLIDMDYEHILQLPEYNGVTQRSAERDGFNLEKEVNDIEEYFKAHELKMLKNMYKPTSTMISDNSDVVSRVVTKLDDIIKMNALSGNTFSVDRKRAYELKQLFKSHRISSNIIRVIKKEFTDEVFSRHRKQFLDKTEEFYKKHMKELPEFNPVITEMDITYKIVCRGALI